MFAAVPAPPASHFAVSQFRGPAAPLPTCQIATLAATDAQPTQRVAQIQAALLHFRSASLHSRPRFCIPDHGYASRCHFSLFPSTKSGFLCAFTLRTPRFRAFQAQNRGFCALLPSETLIFGLFEHKIEVFVRFYPPEPPFSGFSSTKRFFVKFRAVKLSKFGRF